MLVAVHDWTSPGTPGGRETLPANEIVRYALYMRENGEPEAKIGYPGVKLALIGLGRIARRVAKVAQAMEMQVSAFDPYATEPLDGVAMVESIEELVYRFKLTHY